MTIDSTAFIKDIISKVCIILLTAIVMFSCTSLKTVEIEISKTPLYPIGEDIQSVLVLNRSMSDQFSNLKTDSLEKILIDKKMFLEAVIMDSLASDTTVKTTAHALFESNRFDVVIPKELNLPHLDKTNVDAPMDIPTINQYCIDFKTDAVLVLEGFAENIKTQYSVSDEAGEKIYKATTDLIYVSDWRLYRSGSKTNVIRLQVADTINWKGWDYTLDGLYRAQPLTKEALLDGGIDAGLKMARYISPEWYPEKRFYYLTGKDNIDAAIPLIQQNKWKEAAEIWEKYAHLPSRSLRGKVEFNLALAAEMENNFDLALEWGLKSFKSRYSMAVEVYLKQLDARKKQFEKERLTKTY